MKSRKKIREGIDTLEVLKKHFPYIYTKADLTRVFVSGIGTGIVVGIIFWATFATASELRHSFRSPAFNGQGFSSHVLTIENLTHERKQAIKAKKNKKNTKHFLIEIMKISSIDFTVEHAHYKLRKYGFNNCTEGDLYRWMHELCEDKVLIFLGWKPEYVDKHKVGCEAVFGLIGE